MAEVSVNSLALLSYPLPEQSFVQVSVHGTCALAAYDALHSPSLPQSTIELSGVELYVQQALCCLLLCVRFQCVTSRDYRGMLPQSYEQFHTTGRWC